MAKITSNEYVKIAWVLDAAMTTQQASAPPVATLTGAIDLSPAIAWQDFALGATDSDDVDDRGIVDPGNAVTRGFANFEGTLSFFRDANPDDMTSDFVKAWETFKVPRTYGYLVMRVADKKWNEPWAAGDRVSVFRFVADVIVDDAEGDDSVKFTVNFLPQGVMFPYTRVAEADAPVVTPNTMTVPVGTSQVIRATANGYSIRAGSKFSSSDTSKARVSANGVVTGVATGAATVTISHPAIAVPKTVSITVGA